MKGGVFAYESDGDGLVEVFLGRCECAPGLPGLIAFLYEGGSDGEFVEAEDDSEMYYQALFFEQEGNYRVSFEQIIQDRGWFTVIGRSNIVHSNDLLWVNVTESRDLISRLFLQRLSTATGNLRRVSYVE